MMRRSNRAEEPNPWPVHCAIQNVFEERRKENPPFESESTADRTLEGGDLLPKLDKEVLSVRHCVCCNSKDQ